MYSNYRFGHSYWVETWEINDQGIRVAPVDDLTDWYYDHNDITIQIQKSITSNNDTASVEVKNHRVLEKMYAQKYYFFENFFKKNYEVDLMIWQESGDADAPDGGAHVHCIFSGSLTDIYANEDSSITDQSLVLKLNAGQFTSLRSITNRTFPAGITYLQVVTDLFQDLLGYELVVIDDPFNKLQKALPKPRTYHGKTFTLLDSIATDLEMTFGLDSTPWLLSDRRIGGTGNTLVGEKHAYFVDKRSLFDVAGVNGIGPHFVNGSTGKLGRIGYTKSQVTFSHLTDPVLNIGMLVNVSDYGTMNDAIDFRCRVNRLSISNDITQLEASFVGEDGLAVLEENKSNSGGMVL